jgi:hypothetical protein
MTGQVCNRCATETRFMAKSLCSSCLELLGFEAEAAHVKNWEAKYEAAYAAAATAERERLFSILTLPEAVGRRELSIKLCGAPTMTQEMALTILAAAPAETPSGPASEFAAELARLRATTPHVDEDSETETVRRIVAHDDRYLAEQAAARRARDSKPAR